MYVTRRRTYCSSIRHRELGCVRMHLQAPPHVSCSLCFQQQLCSGWYRTCILAGLLLGETESSRRTKKVFWGSPPPAAAMRATTAVHN